ncbi:MAG TPA: cytochrome ubiquinol oxidase subunit I [Ktedonobacterales bacterium]|nr:cytochrome ubiquinol oxidase subunit I [Ktedonobacterales bacterium]
MSNLIAARAAMASTLAFHIIFAALGVGLPVLLCVAEGLGLRNGDTIWYALARRWSQAFSILFIVGAVSGTAISFEMGLLWPRFMGFASAVIGLPFAIEGFAFFMEGIFLGLYLYGWDRLSPRAHWLCSIPVVIGGTASAFFVVTANAWMNAPTGYTASNGHVTSVNPLAAMFNPATPSETVHMILAAYQVSAFAVAAIYAVALLRGRRTVYHTRGLLLPMAFGTIVAPVQAYIGDLSAKMVAHTQPAKLAAMEGLFQTVAGAPLRILGIANPNTQQTSFGIEIPKLLSWLAYGDVNATVKGLDAFPRADWPNTLLVHLAFDLMVGTGILMIVLPAWFWILYLRHGRTIPRSRISELMLWTAVLTGPLAFIALEAGWIVTEVGRQPWIIQGVMRVSAAVTPVPVAGLTILLVFLVIYLTLTVALITLLLRLARTPPKPAQRADASSESESNLAAGQA